MGRDVTKERERQQLHKCPGWDFRPSLGSCKNTWVLSEPMQSCNVHAMLYMHRPTTCAIVYAIMRHTFGRMVWYVYAIIRIIIPIIRICNHTFDTYLYRLRESLHVIVHGVSLDICTDHHHINFCNRNTYDMYDTYMQSLLELHMCNCVCHAMPC